jgi:Fe-S cluster assembly protein SufD
MSMSQDHHIATQYASRLHPGSALAPLQEKAMQAFKTLGLPTVKHEEWKYTRISSTFRPEMALAQHAELSEADVNGFRLPGDAIDIFVVNGVFKSALATEEVTIMPLEQAAAGPFADIVKENLGHSSKYHPDGIHALNTAFVNGGVFIHVKRGKVVEKPIYIYYVNYNKTVSTLALPRTLVYVSAAAQVQIAEHHVSLGSHDAVTNQVTEVIVEQDAVVNYYKIQNEGPAASMVCTTHFRQTGKALCNATTISLSGNIVRNNLNMVMEADHGESHMYGLYLLDGKTLVDNHTIVDNVKPHCFSNELYKGIMDGASTGVFNGKIFVRQDAQKTNAYQSNKNVLLTNEASVNTKPQLEIFADDVKCSHGCTVGKLDEEAMFYLRARGISEKNARSLLLHAFAVDILDNIKTAPLREYVDHLISERLGFNF